MSVPISASVAPSTDYSVVSSANFHVTSPVIVSSIGGSDDKRWWETRLQDEEVIEGRKLVFSDGSGYIARSEHKQSSALGEELLIEEIQY